MPTSSGTVTDVQVEYRQTETTADAAIDDTVLVVDSVAPFNADGGTLMLGETTLAYTAAEGTTITLPEPLTEAFETGVPVLAVLGDKIAEDRWAQIRPDDPDAKSLRARVPTPMYGWLSLDRDYEASPVEVSLVLVGTTWEVTDRPGGEPLVFDSAVRISASDNGIVGGVDDEGNVTAHDLSYLGDFYASADTMLIDGDPLSALLKRFPRGSEAQASYTPSVSGISAAYGLVELTWLPPADYADRLYGIRFVQEMEVSAADTTVAMRIRLTTDGTAPTATSPAALLARKTHRKAGLQGRLVHSELIDFAPTAADPHRFLLTADVTDPTGATASTVGACSLEVVDRGPRMPNQAVKNTGGGTLATGGSDTGTAPVPEKKEYTLSYPATATRWWEGGNLTDNRDSDNQYVGYSPNRPAEGNRRSAVWFNSTKMAADLAGANVLSVRARPSVRDGGRNKTIVLGSHSDATVRSSWNAITGKVEDRTRKSGVNEGSSPTIDLAWGATALQDWATGAIKGLLLGPGPSPKDDQFGFSYFGAGDDNRLVLEITFER